MKRPPVLKAVFLSRSAAETKRLGARLARTLKAGDVVLFLANLGAGKTTFVQGLAKALGAEDTALSPTFVVAETIQARTVIHHLDFYRLNEEEILGIGIEDYLTGSGAIAPGIVLIEWAERFKEIWPAERIEIRIGITPRTDRRRVEVTARGERLVAALRKMKAA